MEDRGAAGERWGSGGGAAGERCAKEGSKEVRRGRWGNGKRPMANVSEDRDETAVKH